MPHFDTQLLRDRFGLLFTLLVLIYLLTGVSDSPLARTAFTLLFVVAIVVAALAEGTALRVRRAVYVLAGAVLVGSLAGLAGSMGDTGWGVQKLGSAALQLAAMVLILQRISRHSTVSFQTVMGGIDAYVLIGFAMGSVYNGVDLLTTSELLGEPVSDGDYYYFSLVTLTTLGFGDLVPVTDLGKRLVTIEALVGQVFLVTLVARLVSLWGRPIERGRAGR